MAGVERLTDWMERYDNSTSLEALHSQGDLTREVKGIVAELAYHGDRLPPYVWICRDRRTRQEDEDAKEALEYLAEVFRHVANWATARADEAASAAQSQPIGNDPPIIV